MNAPAPPVTPLSGRRVDVWPIILEASTGCQPPSAMLSADESVRAARFAFDRDRQQYVVARAALRVLLGAYVRERPEAVEFAYAERGKPYLAGGQSVRFNLTHKAGLALLAFSADCELGVDVEQIVTLGDRDAVATRFFSAEEHREFTALPAAERDRAFFRCWTRKEAYVKCTGNGLHAALDRFRVSLSPADAPRVVAIDGDVYAAQAWTVHDIALPAGYIGALAYRDAERPIRVMPIRSTAELFAAPVDVR